MHIYTCTYIHVHENIVVSPSTANLEEDIPLLAQANLSRVGERQRHLLYMYVGA